MEEERLSAILESLLFAAGEPLPIARLQVVLESVPREAIRKALADLALTYADGSRGIVLEEVAGGYQLRTAREHAYYVRKLLAAKPPRLSRPLLETVAIIAYRQPVTRPEIEQLRGVDSGGVLETLLERGLIRIAGRKEAPGRPIVYATTPEFLEVFSLKDLASLPDLEEFRALQTVAGIAESGEAGADAPAAAADTAAAEPAEHEPPALTASEDSASDRQTSDDAEGEPPPQRSDDNSSQD
ncbi:MAG TPA: SMC-Scp complex subunit ScpB [Candidatus Binataceae bacterium]|nr:SMC-Scp complex subunit ScpB [Candidatus Binataceae bacterium]